MFFYLSKLRLICNRKKIIISSHQLSLFWPLFVNERFMLREGGREGAGSARRDKQEERDAVWSM